MRGLADPDSKIYALLNKAILLVEMPHIISTMLYSRVFDELEGIEPRLPEP